MKSHVRLTKYGGGPITVISKCNLKCKTSKEKEACIEFQIVNEKAPAVLGLPMLERLNLIKKINAIECKKGVSKISKNFIQGTHLTFPAHSVCCNTLVIT